MKANVPKYENLIVNERRIARFWSKVNKSDGCWEWTGAKNNGYGMFWNCYTHRLAFHYLRGPVPADMELDHLCRNRGCVNPDHLEIVTGKENLMRSESFVAINAQKTQCPQGHPYDGENLWIIKTGPRKGKRECRACALDYARSVTGRKNNREAVRRYRARLKSECANGAAEGEA